MEIVQIGDKLKKNIFLNDCRHIVELYMRWPTEAVLVSSVGPTLYDRDKCCFYSHLPPICVSRYTILTP